MICFSLKVLPLHLWSWAAMLKQHKTIWFSPCGNENPIVWTRAKSTQNLLFLSNGSTMIVLCCEVLKWFNLRGLTVSVWPGTICFQEKKLISLAKNLKSESSFLISSWLLGNVLAFWRGVMSSQESLMIHVLTPCSKYKMCPIQFGGSFSASWLLAFELLLRYF